MIKNFKNLKYFVSPHRKELYAIDSKNNKSFIVQEVEFLSKSITFALQEKNKKSQFVKITERTYKKSELFKAWKIYNDLKSISSHLDFFNTTLKDDNFLPVAKLEQILKEYNATI